MESSIENYHKDSFFQIKANDGSIIQLCKISEKDTWNICNFVCANEDRLELYFPVTKASNLTPDLSKRFVDIKTKEFEAKEEFLFTLKPQNSHKVIGLIYLKELDWDKKQGEFAYAIDYNYEGKGITSKVIDELSKYAFVILELCTLQIIVHKSNLPSIKVAEKNDFQWVKTLEKSFIFRGREPKDMELYERYNQ